MALRLSHAVSDGLRRTLSKTGGILFIGLLIVQIGTQAAVNTAVSSYLPAGLTTQAGLTAGLGLPVSGAGALAIFAALVILSAAFFVIIARTMTQPQDKISTIPVDATRRLGRTTLAMLIGGILISVSVFVGTLFFILPGLFLATSFLFIVFTIAVEDRGVIDGLKRSWGLASGSRLKLFALVVLTTVFGGVIGGIAPLLDYGGIPVASEAIVAVVTAAFLTPYYGILAASYLQLRDERRGVDRRSTEPADASGTAEL